MSYRFEGLDALIAHAPDAADLSGRCQFVVIPSLRRVDCIIGESSSFDEIAGQISLLGERGWSVWALVPQHSLPSAHLAFQSCAAQLQGWTVRDGATVSFTAPEDP